MSADSDEKDQDALYDRIIDDFDDDDDDNIDDGRLQIMCTCLS